jgi:hypothetical protein
MSRRATILSIILAALVVLLFVGRWSAEILTDRWWAEQISPTAAAFVVDWELLRLTLEAAGVVVACGWFVGHMLGVYRAIGSVQVPRQLANLEIREAVNSRVLVFAGVAAGTLLGILVGRGCGDWVSSVALSWSGLRYGEAEPLLGHDVGLYLAQLPLWHQVHGYALLLVLLALGGVLTLYAVIGAVRWSDGRAAINTHARAHLGLLLAALALCLLWGYLLEPYERVAGLIEPGEYGLFTYRLATSQVLSGAAVAAAVLSLLWVWRGQHALMAAAWTVLAAASLIGHHFLPAVIGNRPSSVDVMAQKRLEALAYGLSGLKDSSFARSGVSPRLPAPIGLWPANVITRLPSADSGEIYSAERTSLIVAGHPRAVWLVVRSDGRGNASVTAVADDQTSLDGGPLFYHLADSLPTTQLVTRLRVSGDGVWPGAPSYVLDSVGAGVLVGSGLRRLALAWALQAGALLGRVEPDARVHWNLTPVSRLNRLAPFAAWGVASPRVIGGELVWLSDGYLASATFPVTDRVPWRGETVGSIRASFLGVISAESGETRIYLRHTADPVAEAWARISAGVIQPANAIPPEVGRSVAYPIEALQAQSRVLESSRWDLGRLSERRDSAGTGVSIAAGLWEPDTTGVLFALPFERVERTVSAVVLARMVDGWESLRAVRFDSATSLPAPQILENRWSRFPTYEQLRDSVARAGGQVVDGPVHYWVSSVGLGAFQPHFAWDSSRAPGLVWVSVALPQQRGAGRDPSEAWQNLLGVTAPIIGAANRGSQLEEARRLMSLADSALKRGDWAAFGRAFEALRRLLGPQPKAPKF